MPKGQVTIPIDIPGIRVLKTEMNKRGEVIITVESNKDYARCRKCGRVTWKFHGHGKWITVRHLPVFGRPTYLKYQSKRYQCEKCDKGPTTTQQLEWHDPKSPHTIAYDEYLLVQLVNTTITDVSIKEQLPYDKVLGVVERRIDSKVDWGRYDRLGVLGLDEIALKKGHRDFVVLVTARLADGRLVILGVLSNREKETIREFLRFIPQRLQETIHTVCCDMCEGFVQAVREELQKAKIVVDRFHVARHYRKAADRLRKQELKRLKEELPDEKYKQLKGHMWIFRKTPSELKPEERKVLRLLFSYSPKLKSAYKLREALTAIFEQAISKDVARRKIRAWKKRVRKSNVNCFDNFLGTLERWEDEITNYFIHRDNSGFVEGFNNKVKVLKRRCYGIFNLEHLFQRIFLDLEGYRLYL